MIDAANRFIDREMIALGQIHSAYFSSVKHRDGSLEDIQLHVSQAQSI
jgi:hypothetical protein